MAQSQNKMRILIFIGTLWAGGKERRLVELLTYMRTHTRHEFLVILTSEVIYFRYFFAMNIPYRVIKPVDLTIFYKVYKICREFQPDVIHTWGRMQTFYTLPAVLFLNRRLINSQITSAPVLQSRWDAGKLVDSINFLFSHMIIANSKAGINAFRPPLHKSKVIYNGINMNRFSKLSDIESVKAKYGITTPYTVVMSASFSENKDYDLFHRVASIVIEARNDVTFIGVGGSNEEVSFVEYSRKTRHTPRFLLPGRIDDVEALVNASTIGVLFSTNGEGISNSIMEYMALCKPVIANKAGGNVELVRHNENGFLIENESAAEIAALICQLIDDPVLRESFGRKSREIIDATFSLEQMGKEFEQVYTLAAFPAKAV